MPREIKDALDAADDFYLDLVQTPGRTTAFLIDTIRSRKEARQLACAEEMGRPFRRAFETK
jgi:hypothetical protein